MHLISGFDGQVPRDIRDEEGHLSQGVVPHNLHTYKLVASQLQHRILPFMTYQQYITYILK